MKIFITTAVRSLWAAPVFCLAVAYAACTQESSGGADGATPTDGDSAGKTPVDASVEGATDKDERRGDEHCAQSQRCVYDEAAGHFSCVDYESAEGCE